MSCADLDRLVISYTIEGEAVNETPLRVGSGKREQYLGPVDNPVMTYMVGGEERPVIPGSSWKGVLRSEAERLVNSSPEIRDKKNWPSWRTCNIFELAENEQLRKKEEENPCVVCSIFGNTGVASHLYFFDSLPKEKPTLHVIRRVAIDRVVGSQSPGRLFDVQVVPPETRWGFKMRIVNIDLKSDTPQAFLLSHLLRQLIDGIQIGGGRSVGYGEIRLVPETLLVKRMRIEDGILKKDEYRGEEALKILGVK
jgi:CRISPR-associated RAMP protein (TIGR02581 family)